MLMCNVLIFEMKYNCLSPTEKLLKIYYFQPPLNRDVHEVVPTKPISMELEQLARQSFISLCKLDRNG